MISDRVKKWGMSSGRAWYVMAAGLLFLLLLAALVQVVNGQVAQAHLRQTQYQAAQTALSGCVANYSGAARRQCSAQVNARLALDSTQFPEVEVQAGVQLEPPAVLAGQGAPTGSPGLAAHRFTEAVFVSH
ncbi:hypothetical protein [Polaromonas glacialis]|uniref:hypothetical protein n=1 Tax=Polaromonas glacialis TaxID=866564 RepID=UPI000494F74D|nr:hypothetical protein [Polaromonas glacialis]